MLRSFFAVAALVAVALLSGAAPAAHAELSGDPGGASQYWGRQHSDDCTMMAVADVVGEVTGAKPGEDDVVAVAAATPNGSGSPLYAPPADGATGTAERKNQLPNIRDLPPLLAHYGVGSVYTNDAVAARGGMPTGIEALAVYLGTGEKIIASVNGETIWDIAGDRSVHNHALVVTGVDTAAGIVHLNDSAGPHPDTVVSVETFDAAWRTSDHAMVVAG